MAPPPWIRLRAAREEERLAAAGRQRAGEGGETDEGKEKKGRIKEKKRKGKENEMFGGDG